MWYKVDRDLEPEREENHCREGGIERNNWEVCLEQEGNDRLAAAGIVGEFLLVVAVLSQRPHGHLEEAHGGEDGGCRDRGEREGLVSDHWAGRGRLTWE